MELVLNDEQRLLQESAAKLVERSAGPKAHRDARDTEIGFDRGRHKLVAEAGWLSIMVPERADGAGLGITELALMLEQAGRGLMTEPLAACAVTAYTIGIGRAATERVDALEGLVAGKRIIVPALQDPAVAEEQQERVIAMPFHYGYQLSGTRSLVPFAADADAFLLDAQTSDGSIMVIIPCDIHGVKISSTDTVDGVRYGTVTFSDASMMSDEWLIAGAKQGQSLTAAAYDRLLLAVSAEMLGVMDKALELALGYVKTREQFGRPIGSFQALQHRAADDHIDVERVRSLLYQVCEAFDARRGKRSMAAAVKARTSEAVLKVTKSVIQMHGAIGFTDEYDAGLYLRRAMALASCYGNAALHRKRYAALSEAEAAAEAGGTTKRRRRPKPKKSIFSKAVSRQHTNLH
jgi:alkylation response protein AidB-like acyl-CoA dehydrogenase